MCPLHLLALSTFAHWFHIHRYCQSLRSCTNCLKTWMLMSNSESRECFMCPCVSVIGKRCVLKRQRGPNSSISASQCPLKIYFPQRRLSLMQSSRHHNTCFLSSFTPVFITSFLLFLNYMMMLIFAVKRHAVSFYFQLTPTVFYFALFAH